MMREVERRPCRQDRQTLHALFLVEREDGDGSYVRYSHVTGVYGVVYAPAAPLPWGLYFDSAPDAERMVWAKSLDVIAALIVWAASD